MCRILVVFEPDRVERVPPVVEAMAAGARAAGGDVRLAPLGEAAVRDLDWAQAVALGVEGRGAVLPHAAKQWMDALGFSGWRTFRDKPGCVFPTLTTNTRETAPACRMLARILQARGMQAATPLELGLSDPGPDANPDDTAAFGDALGRSFATRSFALAAGRGGGGRRTAH